MNENKKFARMRIEGKTVYPSEQYSEGAKKK